MFRNRRGLTDVRGIRKHVEDRDVYIIRSELRYQFHTIYHVRLRKI